MRILLTNDDGIHAPGLVALETIARELSDDIVVIAPETDQSGVAHSLSLSDPLRVRHIEEGRYAVNGTPTDCVLMGVMHLMKDRKPDLVLSGVNRGQNICEDITYSGTVAGAMEGTLLGIPSIAFSQGYGFGTDSRNPRFSCAVGHGAAIVRKLLAFGFARDTLFNVNFPDCEPADVKGISVTVQGRRDQSALIDVVERQDYRDKPYYWLAPQREKPAVVEGTDLWAMFQKRISVTPIKLDLTDVAALKRLAEVFDEA